FYHSSVDTNAADVYRREPRRSQERMTFVGRAAMRCCSYERKLRLFLAYRQQARGHGTQDRELVAPALRGIGPELSQGAAPGALVGQRLGQHLDPVEPFDQARFGAAAGGVFGPQLKIVGSAGQSGEQ